MDNQVINNVSSKCINFSNLDEVIKFKSLTKTDQSKQIAELISPFIKIVDKKTIYYFNITKNYGWKLTTYNTIILLLIF